MDTYKIYRNADYDIDMHFHRTTSWPEGLEERQQFEPNLPRAVRRMNSADDIQRYKNHFVIAERNQGKWFRWRHYLKVLRDDLRHFDTLVLMSKTLLSHFASPADSEKSLYVTASEAEIIQKPLPKYKMDENKSLLIRRDNIGDSDSLFSMPASFTSASSVERISTNSIISMSPQKNLLKKFCSEVRQLASKTYRTVEKMSSSKSKYCSACGDSIGSMKMHKSCSQIVNLIDNKKPTTTSKLKNTNLARTISMTSMTSGGSGESAVFNKWLPSFPKKKGFTRRMLPFMKENSAQAQQIE